MRAFRRRLRDWFEDRIDDFFLLIALAIGFVVRWKDRRRKR
jgi:hypothetical protein